MRKGVPDRITLRIDKPMRQRLAQEMEMTGATLSQTLRVALAMGLEQEEELPVAFRRASFKEGVVAGIAAFREAGGDGNEITHRALGGVDSALAGWRKS